MQPVRRRYVLHPSPSRAVDLEAAEQAITDLFLPVRLHPVHEPVGMQLDPIASGRVTIGRLRFGAAMRIVTTAPVNYHIDIPLAGQARTRAGNGAAISSGCGAATVFMPGADVDLKWSQDADQLCLMFDKELVQAELRNLLGHEVRKPTVFAEQMDLTSAGGTAWLQTVRLIQSYVRADVGLLRHRLSAQRVEQLLIEGLLLTHPHTYTDDLAADDGKLSPNTGRRAVDLLRQRPEHPWSVAELAAATSVSARYLHNAFRETTGTTPMAYLRDLRLQRVRDDLLAADAKDTTVSDVALSWGFVHLSRFAAGYRRRYGEAPSHTLRSPRPS